MDPLKDWIIPLAEWPFGLAWEELTWLHVSLELLLLTWVLYLLFFAKAYKISHSPQADTLTESEVDDLVSEWVPEPLATPLTESQSFELANYRTISSFSGASVSTPSHPSSSLVNFATLDFLGLSKDRGVLEYAEKALRYYGCGACGPRGFYGTMDIHMELEKKISHFLKVEEVCLYSSNFVVMSSAIPAFAKITDVIFVDERVNYSIRLGATMSRAKVITFKHNDIGDLEEKVKRDEMERVKKGKKNYRKFVCVEGVYTESGALCPLKALLDVKRAHKLRVFVDDTLGIGVLGSHGRGSIEHAGLDVAEFDLVCGALGSVLAGTGGFSAGSTKYAVHQRLNSSGYVFSASLAPYLAAAGIAALKKLEEEAGMLAELKCLVLKFRNDVKKLAPKKINNNNNNNNNNNKDNKFIRWKVWGDDNVPCVHLSLEDENGVKWGGKEELQKVCDWILEKKDMMVTRVKYAEERELVHRMEMLRVSVTLYHNVDMLTNLVEALADSLQIF